MWPSTGLCDVDCDATRRKRRPGSAAPRLPVPRLGRNGVVHLHGFLGDFGDDIWELVLSSADFGAAYLVDGWATRFLRELFRHFVVLFVGYSRKASMARDKPFCEREGFVGKIALAGAAPELLTTSFSSLLGLK